MTKAIRIHEHGGPEVLRWEAVEPGDPGTGQVEPPNGPTSLPVPGGSSRS